MSRGNPGAILAIAIGAIFLSLGWSGRYAAVWDAIRTGKPVSASGPDPNAPDQPAQPVPGEIGTFCTVGLHAIKLYTGETRCFSPYDVKGQTDGKPCNELYGADWIAGTDVANNAAVCTKIGTGKMPITGEKQRAGQVESETEYQSYRLPTGPFAFARWYDAQ